MGHLFITINPKIFIGNRFVKEMQKNIKLVKKLPKAKGFQIFYILVKEKIRRIKRI